MSPPAGAGASTTAAGPAPLGGAGRRLVAAAGALALLAGAAAIAVRRLGDFDLPWHLAFGRIVASRRDVPDIDPLAYTARPIEYTEFVADLFLYGLHALGGASAVQALGGLAAGATAVLLAVHPERARPGWLGWPMIALALAAASPWFVVRPAILSFPLLAALLVLLARHRRTRSRRSLAVTVPMMTAWANVHGFVVVGVAVLALYVGHCVAARLARGRAGALWPVADGHDLGATSAIGAMAIAASCLNVAGVRLLLGPLRATADAGRVTEWARPDLEFLTRTEPASLLFFAACLAAITFGREPAATPAPPLADPVQRSGLGARVPSSFDLGVIALAAVLAASAVRLIAAAAILVTPIAARRAAVLVGRGMERASVRPAITAMACALCALLAAPYVLVRSADSIGYGFEPRNHPEAAVRWIERNQPQGRMYNFLPYGGWLGWRLWPKHQVLVDGRSGWVHDPTLVARVYAAESDLDAFRSLAADMRIDWAVVRAIESEPHGAGVAADRTFTMVHLDDISAVYVRAAGPNANLAEGGYRILRHLTDLSQLLHAARRRAAANDLAHDGNLALEQDPRSPRAAFLAACGALAIRDRASFERALSTLERLAPSHPSRTALEAAWQ